MSVTSPTVPLIAITQDDSDEADQYDGPNIADVATDIEEIDFGPERKKRKQKVHKPPPKRIDSTDDEEVEGVGDELIATIVDHKHPLNVQDVLDLEEAPSYEETFKVEGRGPKNRRKLKTQTSTSAAALLNTDDYEMKQAPTDIEDFDGSDEDDEISNKDEESEIDLMTAITQDLGATDISDSVKKYLGGTPSPMHTPMNLSDNESEKDNQQEKLVPPKKGHRLLTPISMSPQLSDLTDVEILQSDDSNDDEEDEEPKRKPRSKPRRHRNIKAGLTDTEDLYVSDEEAKKLVGQVSVSQSPNFHMEKSKNNTSELRYRGRNKKDAAPAIPSIRNNYETGKKNKKKPQAKLQKSNNLNVEMTEVEGLTDVEDIEAGDSANEEETPIIDCELTAALVEELDFGVTEEKSSTKSNQKLYKTESFVSYIKDIKEENETTEGDKGTDEESYDQDTAGEDNDEVEMSEKDCAIRFVPYKKKDKSSKKGKVTKSNNNNNGLLAVDNEEENLLTDTEYLNSSDEDKYEAAQQVAAVIQNDEPDDTDTESVDELELEYRNYDNVPENLLPKVVREQIIVKETPDDNIINVTPLPDDDNSFLLSVGEAQVNYHTDIEDMSGDEDMLNDPEEIDETTLPDISMTEEGAIESIDLMKTPIKEPESEGETDYEEIRTDYKTKNKKKVYLKDFLEEQRDVEAKLTDCEDIELSDGEKLNDANLMVREIYDRSGSATGIKTDLEEMETSDDDDNKEYDESKYPMTPEPSISSQILDEMSGQMIAAKEGSGPFSKQERKKLNKKNKIINIVPASPMQTDTDEMFTSADDESHHTYSRAETATPAQMRQDLDEASNLKVFTQHTRKLDLEAADEVMYIKGGGFISDQYTDIEELGMSEDDNNLEGKEENKNQVCVCIGGENCDDVSISVAGDKGNISWSNGKVSSFVEGWSTFASSVSYSLDFPKNDPKNPTKKLLETEEKVKPQKLFSTSVCRTEIGYLTSVVVDSIPVYKKFLTMFYWSNNKVGEMKLKQNYVSTYDFGHVQDLHNSNFYLKKNSPKLNDSNPIQAELRRQMINNKRVRHRSGSVGKLIIQYEENPDKYKDSRVNSEDTLGEAKIVPVQTSFNINDSTEAQLNNKEIKTENNPRDNKGEDLLKTVLRRKLQAQFEAELLKTPKKILENLEDKEKKSPLKIPSISDLTMQDNSNSITKPTAKILFAIAKPKSEDSTKKDNTKKTSKSETLMEKVKHFEQLSLMTYKTKTAPGPEKNIQKLIKGIKD